jgi:hypothetical protein
MMLLWNGLETWNRLELRDTRVDHYAQPICFIQPSTQIRVCTKTIHRHKERNPYVKFLNREDCQHRIEIPHKHRMNCPQNHRHDFPNFIG